MIRKEIRTNDDKARKQVGKLSVRTRQRLVSGASFDEDPCHSVTRWCFFFSTRSHKKSPENNNRNQRRHLRHRHYSWFPVLKGGLYNDTGVTSGFSMQSSPIFSWVLYLLLLLLSTSGFFSFSLLFFFHDFLAPYSRFASVKNVMREWILLRRNDRISNGQQKFKFEEAKELKGGERAKGRGVTERQVKYLPLDSETKRSCSCC